MLTPQKCCQKCIWDVSQLKPHFRYCPEAEFQRISFAPPPWERGTIDVTQFHDYSDSGDLSDFSDTSSVFSSRTDLSEPLSSEENSKYCPVKKSGVRNHQSSKPVISSELEKLLDEALLIPRPRERITLGMGVRALITGKPLRRKNTHGFLITNPPLISDELYEDLRVARILRPRSTQADLFIRLINKELNSPRGISMRKALKKFQLAHNTFSFGSGTVGKPIKPVKQRALWKDLRIRRNGEGELELLA
ncbi:putative lyar-type c2hc zinc finger protein [Erysiphe neolycopersici]|uniref:Putative lyar-type c2hc zinc finger protein n=1 Tax=Erysiphe neolycopersici TaxID=212602 RepID=A0A420I7K2_9PEZI|nr:putative lyar-type c2hc zinc finger protein [Erysiphe neolycopersici]